MRVASKRHDDSFCFAPALVQFINVGHHGVFCCVIFCNMSNCMVSSPSKVLTTFGNLPVENLLRRLCKMKPKFELGASLLLSDVAAADIGLHWDQSNLWDTRVASKWDHGGPKMWAMSEFGFKINDQLEGKLRIRSFPLPTPFPSWTTNVILQFHVATVFYSWAPF